MLKAVVEEAGLNIVEVVRLYNALSQPEVSKLIAVLLTHTKDAYSRINPANPDSLQAEYLRLKGREQVLNLFSKEAIESLNPNHKES